MAAKCTYYVSDYFVTVVRAPNGFQTPANLRQLLPFAIYGALVSLYEAPGRTLYSNRSAVFNGRLFLSFRRQLDLNSNTRQEVS